MGFWDWAAFGAAIGVKVFFAVAAFGVCCLAILSVFALVMGIAKWAEKEGE